ncbi:hypothetical protein IQ227_12765 [Anabaena aphanizomenioides LEGE 00250]|uniref:Uncharacterized protein n=1 Tax=Sphaerospermopsis aphanizomenoides LEGE 00250 TaxID=2777972 RepID=A0ABR9VEE7_9CYAN|nr:hypothetical protein [Sphaerospermopsis aphanizomenoides]MBE9236871.1 hypothetical protein [Sphaerospermopsis aphanizomenoides LEGE 00250]
MGFLKTFGNIAGKIIGSTVGGGIEVVGNYLDSNFIKEVGQGVYQSTVASTETLATLADGVVTAVHGVATDDEQKIASGFSDVENAVKSTAIGVGRTLGYTATSVGEVFNGLANNDLEMAGRGAKKVAKVIAVGTLAVGIGDILILGDTIIPDVEIINESLVMEAEIFDNPSDMSEMDVVLYEDVSEVNALEEVSNFTNDVDYVQPHWVSGYERNGTYIEGYWRDGDGNTSENLTSEQGGGYFRSNSST